MQFQAVQYADLIGMDALYDGMKVVRLVCHSTTTMSNGQDRLSAPSLSHMPGCASTGAPGTAPAAKLDEGRPYREGAGRGQCCLRRVRKLIDAHVVSRWLATALGVVLHPSLVSSEALLVERGSDGARGIDRGCLVNCASTGCVRSRVYCSHQHVPRQGGKSRACTNRRGHWQRGA